MRTEKDQCLFHKLGTTAFGVVCELPMCCSLGGVITQDWLCQSVLAECACSFPVPLGIARKGQSIKSNTSQEGRFMAQEVAAGVRPCAASWLRQKPYHKTIRKEFATLSQQSCPQENQLTTPYINTKNTQFAKGSL